MAGLQGRENDAHRNPYFHHQFFYKISYLVIFINYLFPILCRYIWFLLIWEYFFWIILNIHFHTICLSPLSGTVISQLFFCRPSITIVFITIFYPIFCDLQSFFRTWCFIFFLPFISFSSARPSSLTTLLFCFLPFFFAFLFPFLLPYFLPSSLRIVSFIPFYFFIFYHYYLHS